MLGRMSRHPLATPPAPTVARVLTVSLVSFVALGLAMVTGCSGFGPGTVYVPEDVPRVKDGLDLVTEGAYFDREYLKSGLDLAAYDAVLIHPLTLVYTAGYKRNHRFDRNEGVKHLIPDARLEQYRKANGAQLQQMFHKALARQLEHKGGYRVVDAPGPKVLTLSAEVINLDLEPAIAEQATANVGYYSPPPVVMVAATLRDGGTGAVVGEILNADSNPDAPADADSFWGQIDDAFDDWGGRLRAVLDQARAQAKQ